MLFTKFQPLTIFAKRSVLNVCLGSKYASENQNRNYENFSIVKVVEWRVASEIYKRKNLKLHLSQIKVLCAYLFSNFFIFVIKESLRPRKCGVESWILFNLADFGEHHHSNQIYHQTYYQMFLSLLIIDIVEECFAKFIELPR